MDIVYMLENLTKTCGRRFYIGSKTECMLETVDGVDRIVSTRTGRLYYGSSTCLEMKEDMQNHHVFHAKILEVVKDKRFMLDVENKWIKHFNAVDSDEFYNRNYATVGNFNVDQNAPFNQWGETIMGYGKLQSSFNKKNNTAKRFGFSNLGEFCVWIWTERLKGKSWPEIADAIGWERHQPQRYVSSYDMDKCMSEYNPNDEQMRTDVRLTLSKGASVSKVSELFGIEIPTVIMYLGDYDNLGNRSYIVAQRQGLTKDELEIKITKMVLDGMSYNDVSKILKLNQTSVRRYFLRCVRSRLKSSDL